jgi:hypothetical protein
MTPAGPPPDPLADVLDLARREGALQGEALVAFADALRERARLVLAERVKPLEDRVRQLEAEAASLRKETDWRRESAEQASDAHGALLAHHRELVERVATELVSIASLSPLRARQARRRLRALAALLRADSR